jgi:SAM-dependent methyltransferase
MLTVDFNLLDLKPGDWVLDAGCGLGRHACEAYRKGSVHVMALDWNWNDLCQTGLTMYLMDEKCLSGWYVSRADVTRLPFKEGVFDAVICSEVLEHISDSDTAVNELVRVLKPGKNLVVSVPRFLPERICWAISEDYHNEPGGHIRIYRKNELKNMLEKAGTICWNIHYRHGLHSPYWWLKCAVGHKREDSRMVNLYKKFLEWDIIAHPPVVRRLEEFLNPLIAKSIVFYLRKGSESWN